MSTMKFRNVADVSEELTGYRPPTQTWLRWVVHGKSGIRLKAFQLGGEWKTTPEYMQEFYEATTQATIEARTQSPSKQAKSRSVSARAKAIARAARELSEAGI
jgi:hypothetical protein